VLLLAGGAALAGCSSGPERSVASLCNELVTAQSLDEVLADGDMAELDEQAATLRRAVKVAPEDIEPSVALVSSTIDAVAATAATAGVEGRATMAEALAANLPADKGAADQLAAAGTAVEQWSATHCGLDLSSGTTVLPPPSSDPTTPTP
jgi:hypothetical protein